MCMVSNVLSGLTDKEGAKFLISYLLELWIDVAVRFDDSSPSSWGEMLIAYYDYQHIYQQQIYFTDVMGKNAFYLWLTTHLSTANLLHRCHGEKCFLWLTTHLSTANLHPGSGSWRWGSRRWDICGKPSWRLLTLIFDLISGETFIISKLIFKLEDTGDFAWDNSSPGDECKREHVGGLPGFEPRQQGLRLLSACCSTSQWVRSLMLLAFAFTRHTIATESPEISFWNQVFYLAIVYDYNLAGLICLFSHINVLPAPAWWRAWH